jgi:signal transduction histidine kinase
MPSAHSSIATVLDEKTRVIIDAIAAIAALSDEEDVLVQAGLALDELDYPDSMFSFVRQVNGGQHILAEKSSATGEKFKEVARVTDRPFPGPDLLAKVLERGQAKFIPDSRVDEENARDLCTKLEIVTQYVVPLLTPTLKIGTLQVLMPLKEQPRDECRVLDALAAHVAVAIERIRVREDLTAAYEGLLHQQQKIVHAEQSLVTVHGLSVPLDELDKQIDEALRNAEIRSNRAALQFIGDLKGTVRDWSKKVEAALEPSRLGQESRPYAVAPLVGHVATLWYRAAKRVGCAIRADKKMTDATASLVPNDLVDALSCLVNNAFQAHAREIVLSVNVVSQAPPMVPLVEISVQDDGDGIPEAVKQAILRYGYTSKKKGHGMGLAIVSLLTKKMGGSFAFAKWGKCSGEPHTVAVIRLPFACPR